VWLGDAERVRHALADMEVFRGRRLDMARLTASAGLAAMEGRTEEAADGYARAAEAVREMESPLDLALSQLDRVITLGTNDVDGKAAAEEARSVFERLGATPFLQRLDETETREATAPR
jgi:hypothetical protein